MSNPLEEETKEYADHIISYNNSAPPIRNKVPLKAEKVEIKSIFSDYVEPYAHKTVETSKPPKPYTPPPPRKENTSYYKDLAGLMDEKELPKYISINEEPAKTNTETNNVAVEERPISQVDNGYGDVIVTAFLVGLCFLIWKVFG